MSVPANIANPTSDLERAGASFVSSPVTATTLFSSFNPNTHAYLCNGWDLAKTFNLSVVFTNLFRSFILSFFMFLISDFVFSVIFFPNQSISIIDSKIIMLKNITRRRNLQILSLQLFFEKNNSFHKIRKKNKNNEKAEDEIRKQIYILKIKKAKCEENFIKRKQLEKEINKENLLFSAKKAEIIEKILDYKILICENTKNNNYNSNNNNIHNDHNDESTIINDSYIFDNEYNILETKENINILDDNNNILKNINNEIINEKEDEKLNKIKNNEINCIKNKNAADYFVPRFLVETKIFNKTKNINKCNPNSKFNIFINCSGK